MSRSESNKVVIAMSGGVDSSVAALLLKQQGYEVIGMMLRLWTEPEKECQNACCTPESMEAARKVAAMLDIPFYVVDCRDYFYKEIVLDFMQGYRAGITPNPCVRCNKIVRWGFLLDEARNLGAHYLATGHYARLEAGHNGRTLLRKGLDANKDQSYVLSGLNQQQLSLSKLPLGNMKKTEVREIARKNHITSAEKPDSQDLCFLAGEDYRKFLRRNAANFFIRGPIKDTTGKILGEHTGLADYTIGQRKGLGAIQEPYYVIRKEIETNTLVIGKEVELGADSFLVNDMNWIIDTSNGIPTKTEVKIRYKAPPVPAHISTCEEGLICVEFDRKLRDITPGQLAVLYDGDLCLGSGLIKQVIFS